MRTCLLALSLVALSASAAEPHRGFYELPSSNGWGAVSVDLQRSRAHHWRDHLFATEEPRWDAEGNEVWSGGFPEAVATRDLLYDAYFGVRTGGQGTWLADQPTDLDASGWAPGTNLVRIMQTQGDLRLTTWVWAPWELERSALALVLEVENLGSAAVEDLSVFGLQNLHLGEGRPGPTAELGAQNETLEIGADGHTERAFAGVVATRAVPAPTTTAAWSADAVGDSPYVTVAAGADLVASTGDQGVHDDSVAYLQWDLPALAPGGTAHVGFVMAHHGDPFAGATVDAELAAWIDGRAPATLLADELADWAAFQASLTLPTGLSPAEEQLARQSAVTLRMAQVREDRAYLREWLSTDGEPRYSVFGALPAEVEHLAAGGVLASLPPGQWTYSWPRDAAYAVLGMSWAGMHQPARAALRYQLDALTDRYREWDELDGVPLEPYAISLCRHHGFGVEESDTLGGGDINVEFDGPGLFLWSLDHYVQASGDWSLVENRWPRIRDAVAGVLLPLVDPATGLIARDSSIWEHHWLGKERYWAYTSITASRGLCAAATFAEHMEAPQLAATYREAAEGLRAAVVTELGVPGSGIAQTREERLLGTGYADGATIEAVAMGLLDPEGALGPGTLDLLIDELQTEDGPGFSRNDDAWDAHELSPWGGVYDSDEWVVIDLRTAVAARVLGDEALADELLAWITAQSAANYDAIGETYDPASGDYTNNAPMVGFGAGAYLAALHHRAGTYAVEPACGAYASEAVGDDDDSGDDDDDSGDDDDSTGDDDDSTGDDDEDPGCACAADGAQRGAPLTLLLLLVPLLRRRPSGTSRRTGLRPR